MKRKELQNLISISYRQVALNGRDAARIYHAVVELDGQVLEWKKRAIAAGWVPEAAESNDPEPAEATKDKKPPTS